jgi:ribosomal-protein-serine acetyltransferase
LLPRFLPFGDGIRPSSVGIRRGPQIHRSSGCEAPADGGRDYAAAALKDFEVQLSADCGLRLLREPDAEELYALIAENRGYLAEWMPWPAAQTLEGTEQFIRLALRQRADDNGFQAAILLEGAIAGVSGFHAVDWANRTTSIGYWLAEPHQGRGIMTGAVRALTEHAFGAWKLERVEIRAAPGNTRSRAIPERLGFTEEGTLRAVERVGDRQLDNVVYSMLASEWRNE